ncbi:MAG: DUF4157 domain-containing protein [Acidobacteriota bacterium]|nr:DUF4157 domain-containing protein [Acidobacteriota bacterium]
MGAQAQATQANANQSSDAGKQAEHQELEREQEKEEVRGVPSHLPPEPRHSIDDFDIEPPSDAFRLEPPPGRPAHVVLQRSVDEQTEPDEAPEPSQNRDSILAVMQRHAQSNAGDLPKNGDGEAVDKLRSMASGPGRSLDDDVRGKMEHAFGQSFSDVRVHEGEAAPSIGATAYTQGADIHFAPGKYQPGTPQGQALLGHELTHVVQQRAGRVAVPQGQGLPINSQDHLEHEADVLGARAARGEIVRVSGVSGHRTARLAAIQAKFSKRVVSSHLDAAVKGLKESDKAEKVPDDEDLTPKKKKALEKARQDETRELVEGHLDAALKNIRGGSGGSGGGSGAGGEGADKKKKGKGDMATKGVAAMGMAASMFGPVGMAVGAGLMLGVGAYKLGKGFRDYGRKRRALADKKKKKLKGYKPGWMDRNVWSKFKNQDEIDKKKREELEALNSDDDLEMDDEEVEEQPKGRKRSNAIIERPIIGRHRSNAVTDPNREDEDEDEEV